MSLKKVWEEKRGCFLAKVFRNSEYDCFVAKLYLVDGGAARLLTDNEQATKQDAIATAQAELGRMVNQIGVTIETPTDVDLAYLDEQASVMAMQFNKSEFVFMGEKGSFANESDKVTQAEAVIDWADATNYLDTLPESKHTMYRLVLFIAGHDVEGPWQEYKPEAFATECFNLGKLGVGFSVEFN